MRPISIFLFLLAASSVLFMPGCVSPPGAGALEKQPGAPGSVFSNPSDAPVSPAASAPPADALPADSLSDLPPCLGLGCELPAQLKPSAPPFRPARFVQARPSETVSLANGGEFALSADITKKTIGNLSYFMYGYNAQIPGPVLRVSQGSNVTIYFTNNLDQPTTVHWHGLRLDNRYDGVPGITQEPVPPGGNFTYHLVFPDAGTFWYHPHVREEVQQERGLYGMIWVEPGGAGRPESAQAGLAAPIGASSDGPAYSEIFLVLDDFMADAAGEPFAHGQNQTDFAAMGRYGNRPLLNGEGFFSARLRAGEVMRLHLLDAANVRPFNLSVGNAPLKVVGSDSGPYERAFFAGNLVISPSERYVVELSFPRAGRYPLLNVNPFSTYQLGEFVVEGPDADVPDDYQELGADGRTLAEIDAYRPYFNKTPDFEYILNISFPGVGSELGTDLMDHPPDGIEWEDTMLGMNKLSTNESLTWEIVDARTGQKNMEMRPEVRTGQVFKIRIKNPKDAPHPMQHVMHLHGARFLVLDPDGKNDENLVWKDSVMIPSGSAVDLLAEFPRPGEWMLHCHIAEHLGSGMMTSFEAE